MLEVFLRILLTGGASLVTHVFSVKIIRTARKRWVVYAIKTFNNVFLCYFSTVYLICKLSLLKAKLSDKHIILYLYNSLLQIKCSFSLHWKMELLFLSESKYK